MYELLELSTYENSYIKYHLLLKYMNLIHFTLLFAEEMFKISAKYRFKSNTSYSLTMSL